MVDERQWQTEQFRRYRARLHAVAYRMLGSVTDAEDAVQEAWLRWTRSAEQRGIDNLGGWLVTVVGRICLDMLRARRARPEDSVGTRLPEPVVGAAVPDDDVLLADSVGLALLVVLQTLSPAERLAFVLHDIFDVPFEEIAPIVDRSSVAARQLASRARRRVRGAKLAGEPNAARQGQLVDAFLAASRQGDFDRLVAILDPEVVFRVDTGATSLRMPALINGAHDVARHMQTQGRRFAARCRTALVNGAPGLVVQRHRSHAIAAVVAFGLRDGRIATIDFIADPEKLRRVPPVATHARP